MRSEPVATAPSTRPSTRQRYATRPLPRGKEERPDALKVTPFHATSLLPMTLS
jgi:hypothetical protein